jgi:hypothetical protein
VKLAVAARQHLGNHEMACLSEHLLRVADALNRRVQKLILR